MNSPPTPTAPTKSLRRSDIKQLRRRLTCSALRVWGAYTYVEQALNGIFADVQAVEVQIAEPGVAMPLRASLSHHLEELRADAAHFASLATWYKSGHEQLNSMIAFAEQTIKEMA